MEANADLAFYIYVLIVLMPGDHTEMSSQCVNPQVGNCSCLIPLHFPFPRANCGGGGEELGGDGARGEPSPISARWWVYSSPLPGGPRGRDLPSVPSRSHSFHFHKRLVMTLHRCKAERRSLEHLLGRRGNLPPCDGNWVVLSENATRG